jgi:hypothetical protein
MDLKDILIKKIEKAIHVGQNTIIRTLKTHDNKEEKKELNNSIRNFELHIQKKAYKNNYFEEKLFDPLEIALNKLKKFKRSKMKQKFNLLKTISPYYNSQKSYTKK